MSFLFSAAHAHGGGLDSSGGHNCYVGSCKGTYHSHKSTSSNNSNSESMFFEVIILIFLAAIFYGILSSHKEKADQGGFFVKLIHIIISLFLIVAFIGSAAYLLS
jgi:hypothetical protein